MNDLTGLVGKWQHRKILVAGDLYADVFMDCKIARVSREAPVFVLEPTEEKLYLGGAANVIHNGATLGGDILAAGIVGKDVPGSQLQELLDELRVDCRSIIRSEELHTITKQRITAWDNGVARQHVARIDRVPKKGFAANDSCRMTDKVLASLTGVDAVVLSDYGNGTLQGEGVRRIIAKCRELDIPTFVDSRYSISEYRGIGYVKQNEAELANYCGLEEFYDDSEIFAGGRKLLDELGATAIMVTLGARGAAIVERGAEYIIPSLSKAEVFDVSGAGDTFTITAALAIAAGAGIKDAVHIANAAAGVVVRKAGTATLTVAELIHELKIEAEAALEKG